MCKTLNRKYIYKYGEKKEDVEIVENMLNRILKERILLIYIMKNT